MGANPWSYFVDYEPNITSALDKLKEREFQAGRYFPAIDYADFPLRLDSANSSPQHPSIQSAIFAAGEDGTQSILDVDRVSESICSGCIAALEVSDLIDIFGTEVPAYDEISENIPDAIFDFIGRGEAVYIVLFKDSLPTKLLFVGYSYD
jgi:hypothetical protein